MTKLRRLPAANDVQHLYQRSSDRGIIFYTQKDRAVFTTIFYSLCKRYNLRPLGLCIMMTHFHIALKCESQSTISAFMRDLESIFAKEYNAYYERSGPLFGYRFGQSAKRSLKSIITILSYIYNNPVAAGLCMKAEEYRWGFLPYRNDSNPYSEVHRSRHSSNKLKRAIGTARHYLVKCDYLGYEILDHHLSRLTDSEKQQLIDCILSICTDSIDFDGLVSYFGDWETMLTAFASNTGSEYELKEESEGKSDMRCLKLIKYASQYGLPSKRRHFRSLSQKERGDLTMNMMRYFDARRYDIERVLHTCITQDPDQ